MSFRRILRTSRSLMMTSGYAAFQSRVSHPYLLITRVQDRQRFRYNLDPRNGLAVGERCRFRGRKSGVGRTISFHGVIPTQNDLTADFVSKRLLNNSSYTILFDYRKLMRDNQEFKPPYFLTDSIKYVSQQTRPRLIKTHLPWELLPKQIQNGSRKPKVALPSNSCQNVFLAVFLDNLRGKESEGRMRVIFPPLQVPRRLHRKLRRVFPALPIRKT